MFILKFFVNMLLYILLVAASHTTMGDEPGNGTPLSLQGQLTLAIRLADADALYDLINNKGAQVNALDEYGNLAIKTAINQNQLSIADMLFKMGVRGDTVLGAKKVDLLTYAVQKRKNKGWIDLILKNYPNLLSVDYHGWSCLMYTCRYNRPDVAKALLDAGTPVDMQDYKGISGLGHCAEMQSLETGQVLLDYGAYAKRPDNRGITPIDRLKLHVTYPGAVLAYAMDMALKNPPKPPKTHPLLPPPPGVPKPPFLPPNTSTPLPPPSTSPPPSSTTPSPLTPPLPYMPTPPLPTPTTPPPPTPSLPYMPTPPPPPNPYLSPPPPNNYVPSPPPPHPTSYEYSNTESYGSDKFGNPRYGHYYNMKSPPPFPTTTPVDYYSKYYYRRDGDGNGRKLLMRDDADKKSMKSDEENKEKEMESNKDAKMISVESVLNNLEGLFGTGVRKYIAKTYCEAKKLKPLFHL